MRARGGNALHWSRAPGGARIFDGDAVKVPYAKMKLFVPTAALASKTPISVSSFAWISNVAPFSTYRHTSTPRRMVVASTVHEERHGWPFWSRLNPTGEPD